MGIQFNKSIKLGKHLRMNLSKRGISFTVNAGPVSVNTNGRRTIKLAKGWKYVTYKKKK